MAKAITGKSGELTSGILDKLEDIQVIKFTGYKQAWSLSEDMVQKIAEVSAELETDQATGQVTRQALLSKHISKEVDTTSEEPETGQATGQVTRQPLLSEHVSKEVDSTSAEPETGQVTGQVIRQALLSEDVSKEADSTSAEPETGQAQNAKNQKMSSLIGGLTQTQIDIMRTCSAPVSIKEMMQILGIVGRDYLRIKHLRPLLEHGIVKMQYPNNPNHPRQRYYLSEYGKEVLQALQLR